MKTCCKCNVEKSILDFPFRAKTTQIDSWCRECKRQYNLRYYQENLVGILAAAKAKHAANPEPARAAAREVYHADPAAAKARCKKWNRENPDKVKGYDLKKNYGVTLEEWNNMFQAQGGLCAICNTPGGKKGLGLDHSHVTGKPRGLLCGRCNTALGLLQDSYALLSSAYQYLTRTQ